MLSLQQNSISRKFQRSYQMQIEGQDGEIFKVGSDDLTQPRLTLEFSVSRATMASAQSGVFRLKNLPENFRNQLGFDDYNRGSARSLIVKAGYLGTPLSTVFNGQLIRVSSCREEGGVDWITEIEAQDFSLLISNTFSKWTIGSQEAPKTRNDVIGLLVNDLKLEASKRGVTLSTGYIGDFEGTRYSYTANDNTWNLLQVETDRLSYIDNGKIYCLPNGDSFQGDVQLISSGTGLLGTPKIRQLTAIVEMLFEPSLVPGQSIFLDTSSGLLNSKNNGSYVVVGVHHSGIISNTVGGKCKTIVQLQLVGTPISVIT